MARQDGERGRTTAVTGSRSRPGAWPVAAGAAAAALAGAALFNHRRARQAERANPPGGAFLRVGGLDLHYLDRGVGSPVLLLHGNGAMAGDWQASGVLDALSERHRVIVFDRPGFGHTARPRSRIWSPQAQAALFAEALDRLGVERTVVVGHSWGVLPALALALEHRPLVAELVLMSGVYYPELRSDIVTSLPGAIPGIGDLLCHSLTPLAARAMLPMQTRTIFAPAPVPEAYAGFPVSMSLRPSQMRAQVKETVILPAATAALSGRYGALEVPVTIVTGSGDRIAAPASQSRRLHRALRGSRYVELPGIGHMANYSALDRVVALIEEAAARAEAAKPG